MGKSLLMVVVAVVLAFGFFMLTGMMNHPQSLERCMVMSLVVVMTINNLMDLKLFWVGDKSIFIPYP